MICMMKEKQLVIEVSLASYYVTYSGASVPTASA